MSLIYAVNVLYCFRNEPFPLYTMSYIWYTGLGVLTTVVVGMLVSLVTGKLLVNPLTLFIVTINRMQGV